ncbi:DciA family protein [Streptomyces sp. NPDC005548]|uniref:DciA family protein n=1 Tax=Streptomyces sp. NPDC005548 TaxID=3364724 RepID=UPI0036B8949D
MPDTPQLTGRDLARQALDAYKATSHTAPTNTPARPKTRRTVRQGSRREPITLAAAITQLGADVPIQAGITGGNLIDQWATLCPQYTDTVQPVAYDTERCRLDLRPSSQAYAAQLRLLGGQLAKQINDKLGTTAVRSIRVLPVGAITPAAPPATGGTRPDVAAAAQPPAAASQPSTVLEDREARPGNLANREPEQAFTAAIEEAARAAGPQLSRCELARRAAIARKRKEAAGRAPRPAFDLT